MKYSRSLELEFNKLSKLNVIDLYNFSKSCMITESVSINTNINVDDQAAHLETSYNSIDEFNEDILNNYSFDILQVSLHGRNENRNESTFINIHYRANVRWLNLSVSGNSKSWVDNSWLNIKSFYHSLDFKDSFIEGTNYQSNNQVSSVAEVSLSDNLPLEDCNNTLKGQIDKEMLTINRKMLYVGITGLFITVITLIFNFFI
jgi:hypothetical protein